MSHLLQMRGLKPLWLLPVLIEVLSHLLQMRGLKLYIIKKRIRKRKSHLLQMRGLKHENHETSCKTLRILFLTKIQHLTKLFSLIGNDLETSEVLIFATSCINQKNALSEYKDTISFLNLSIICSKIREIILFEKCNS